MAQASKPQLAAFGGSETYNAGSAVTVAEGYERWAATYDHDPNPLLACEERYLLPIVSGLNPKRLLDLACGTGRWLGKLASEKAGVGIDSSAAMLRIAKDKDLVKGTLTQACCEQLPFRAASFDLVICSFALGHVQNLASMARELASVTAPGAHVFLSDLHPEAYARGWRVGFRDHSSPVQIEMLPRSSGEIVQLMRSNGFGCVKQTSLSLGEAEKPIFARAGKVHFFAEACESPAVLVCHFRRDHLPLENRRMERLL